MILNSAYSQKTSEFAIGIVPSINNNILSYAIVTKTGNTFLGTQQISEQFFMYYALGYWPCRANPKKINIFKENKVPNIELAYDKANKVIGYYNTPIHEMWKIKYPNHPYRRDLSKGWGLGNYNPSPAQARYIYEHYSVLHINTHYFIGEKLFKLLKDVQNPEWVAMYQSLS